jgi:hypothetical protein
MRVLTDDQFFAQVKSFFTFGSCRNNQLFHAGPELF